MKVKDLIERLAKCNPEAKVVFHEYMECDGLMDYEFSPLRHVTEGYAMSDYVSGGDNEITVYEAAGVHEQGYKIDLPVVALSTWMLKPMETNASSRLLSGREQEVIDAADARS